MTTTDTEQEQTNASAPSLDKLQSMAIELRAKMATELTAMNDSKVRKLGNELAAVNKDILDFEATAQVADRTKYTSAQDEAISAFEIDGFTLTVNWQISVDDGSINTSIVYTPTDVLIQSIKTAMGKATWPTSVTKWKYYTDDKGARQFDLGKSSGRNGTRTAGWLDKDGNTVQLGVAFDAVATSAQKKEMTAMDTASKQNAFKATTVTAGGYSKK